MGKLTDLVQAEVPQRGPSCSVASLSLDKATRAELNALVADVSLPATAICRALDKLGYRLSSTTLQRHRRGDCSCGQSD